MEAQDKSSQNHPKLGLVTNLIQNQRGISTHSNADGVGRRETCLTLFYETGITWRKSEGTLYCLLESETLGPQKSENKAAILLLWYNQNVALPLPPLTTTILILLSFSVCIQPETGTQNLQQKMCMCVCHSLNCGVRAHKCGAVGKEWTQDEPWYCCMLGIVVFQVSNLLRELVISVGEEVPRSSWAIWRNRDLSCEPHTSVFPPEEDLKRGFSHHMRQRVRPVHFSHPVSS